MLSFPSNWPRLICAFLSQAHHGNGPHPLGGELLAPDPANDLPFQKIRMLDIVSLVIREQGKSQGTIIGGPFGLFTEGTTLSAPNRRLTSSPTSISSGSFDQGISIFVFPNALTISHILKLDRCSTCFINLL